MLRLVVLSCCSLSVLGFVMDRSIGDALGSVASSLLTGGSVHPVSALDVSKYTGRWYQVYESESVKLTFERNAFCVTADYTLTSDGRMKVVNTNNLESETGPRDVINGYATKTGEPGKMSVQLETVPVPAPYWVIKLGPATYGPNGQYQYSVVTDNLKATLFVLARDVDSFRRNYEQEVLSFLKAQGFTLALNKPMETVHDHRCVYAPTP